MATRAFWGLWLLVCVALPGNLFAQEGRSAEELEAISQLALKRASEGEFRQAIELWSDILDEVPETTALDLHVNIAVAYQRLKQLPEAWYHLNVYVVGASNPDAAVVKEHKRLGKTLGKSLTRVTLTCRPAARLRFSSDDLKSYPCPLDWYLPRGQQTVVAEQAGYQPLEHTFTVGKQPGGETLALVKKVVPATLVVQGDGKAVQVFLDGRLEGVVPFERKLQPGTYELMVARPGEMPWKKTLVLGAGETVLERPSVAQKRVVAKVVPEVKGKGESPEGTPGIALPASAPAPSRLLEWSLIGGGGAVVVSGAIFHLLAGLKSADLLDEFPADQSLTKAQFEDNAAGYQDAWDKEVKPKAIAAYVMYGVGAAAAVTGTVLLLVKPGQSSASDSLSHTLYPLVTTQGSGLGFQLSF